MFAMVFVTIVPEDAYCSFLIPRQDAVPAVPPVMLSRKGRHGILPCKRLCAFVC